MVPGARDPKYRILGRRNWPINNSVKAVIEKLGSLPQAIYHRRRSKTHKEENRLTGLICQDRFLNEATTWLWNVKGWYTLYTVQHKSPLCVVCIEILYMLHINNNLKLKLLREKIILGCDGANTNIKKKRNNRQRYRRIYYNKNKCVPRAWLS